MEVAGDRILHRIFVTIAEFFDTVLRPREHRIHGHLSQSFYPVHCILWTNSEGLAHRQVPGVTIRRTAVVEPHHNALLLLNRKLQSSAIARDNIVIT